MVLQVPSSDLHLLRGPAIVAIVLLSWLYPIVTSWSWTFLGQLAVACIGLSVCIVDLSHASQIALRYQTAKFVNSIVLDDILQLFFDPEYGIVPCMIGLFVGGSSMYGLRMDEGQRVRLVMASLWTQPEETRQILFQPGGCKLLLPVAVQEWLTIEEPPVPKTTTTSRMLPPSSEEFVVHTTTTTSNEDILSERLEAESEGSISEYHVGSDHERDMAESLQGSPPSVSSSPREGEPTTTATTTTRELHQEQQVRHCHANNADPLFVMLSILRDMLQEQIRPMILSIPEAEVEMVGASAFLAWAVQIGLRWRCRSSLLGTASSVLLSGVAAGSFSTLMVRQAALGTIQDMSSLRLIGGATIERACLRLKLLALRNGRWKNTLAFIVLLLAGRKKQILESSTTLRMLRQAGILKNR